MKVIPVRTRHDDVADAIRSLDEAILEAQRMRGHLESFPADNEDGQLGILRAAMRSGKIASAMVEQALTRARGAQCDIQSGSAVS
jgi:hypothetical protein